MTTFLLIRHAAHDWLQRGLAGRLPGVSLNEAGRREAEALAVRLANRPIRAVLSSPLERARETAAPLARRLGIEVEPAEPLNEIDFGDWTGRSFADLESDPGWRLFNSQRSTALVPGGESMLAAQARVVGLMTALCPRFGDAEVALVSHGDIVKAAVAYVLGVPLDLFQRIEISPASVSIVAIEEWGIRVLRVNDTGAA